MHRFGLTIARLDVRWISPGGNENGAGQDAQTAAELQKQHLAFMEDQHRQGPLLVAGPFMEPGTRRGLVIYRAASLEEAKTRASGDPMIKAGRLALELHPWAVPKGALQ